MQKQKVCIIGAGLTGLITAISLSKLNIKIDLISKDLESNLKNSGTVAISSSNYEFLKTLGIFENTKNIFWPCSAMKLYTENKKNNLQKIFEFKNIKKNILYMTTNKKIMQKTIANIKKNNLISFISKKTISKIISTDNLSTVLFNNGETSKYNLIIMCTGSGSNLIENYFNEKVFKRSYDEIAATTIISHNLNENNVAKQFFLNEEILAFLPISKTETSIVCSTKQSKLKNYQFKNNLFFKKKIKLYSKSYLRDVKFLNDINYINLNMLIRKEHFKDRVLLFGDALHTVHPLAGQGFNMILRDLQSLKKSLKSKIDIGLDIGSSDILTEYTNQIKPRNLIYCLGIDSIKNLFAKDHQTLKSIRNFLISKLNNNNFVKKYLYNIADRGFEF